MSEYSEARAAIYDAYVESGLWTQAAVKQSGPLATVYVGYEQPTDKVFGQAATQQHAMRYRSSDLPRLKEGDAVSFLDDDGNVIKTRRFRVREAPFVVMSPLDNSGDGFWRKALLTQL